MDKESGWARGFRSPVVLIGPGLAVVMVALFRGAVGVFGVRYGLLAGFVGYWAVCGGLVWTLLDGEMLGRLVRGFGPVSDVQRYVYWSIVWIPVVGTFVSVFLEYAGRSGPWVLGCAALSAAINAPLEEGLWRGVFVAYFPDSRFWGWLYPAAWFGAWHLAIYWSAGNPLHGGAAALVGGAFGMGFLWGWVAWRMGSIVPTTIAHVAANFFAFTGYLSVI
jgi:membrane protease YdiL (CAAX protease family)